MKFVFLLTLAKYVTLLVIRTIGLCFHWAFSGVPASTRSSQGALISMSVAADVGFGTFIGGGGAGRDFLCRCLNVPVFVFVDFISSFNC